MENRRELEAIDTSAVNQAVLKLWGSSFQSDADVLVPLIYPPMKQATLLFIGLNPSFNEKGFRTFLEKTPYSNIDPVRFYHWSNREAFDLERAKAIEIEARKKYAYFSKFREIAKCTSMEWEHIDLFFYRATNQKDFKDKILDNSDLAGFVRGQLDLSKKLIYEALPKVIVVANAFASELLKKEFRVNWDDEKGYHVTRFNDRTIPVFLASMLTGQRAMDKGSYKRLKWHIKKALEHSA